MKDGSSSCHIEDRDLRGKSNEFPAVGTFVWGSGLISRMSSQGGGGGSV
jgi:hypothetical protein